MKGATEVKSYVVLGGHGWGKGTDLKKIVKDMRRNGLWWEGRAKHSVIVFAFSCDKEKLRVDMTGVYWPAEETAMKLTMEL